MLTSRRRLGLLEIIMHSNDWGPFGPASGALEDQVLRTRTVLMFGEVTPALARTVTQHLLLLSSHSTGDVKLIVNAHGGLAREGEAIFDVIRAVGPRVKALGIGSVANAALPHARFSLYQNLGPARGGASNAAVADMVAEAHEVARQRERIFELLARETGQTIEAIDRDADRQLWLSAEDALRYGLVGRIVEAANEL